MFLQKSSFLKVVFSLVHLFNKKKKFVNIIKLLKFEKHCKKLRFLIKH